MLLFVYVYVIVIASVNDHNGYKYRLVFQVHQLIICLYLYENLEETFNYNVGTVLRI